MGFSKADYLAMQVRVDSSRKRSPLVQPSHEQDTSEVGKNGLHRKIMAWCDSQWPKWKYRHSRTDKPSREEIGVEDFTLFAPNGVTYHIECKAKGGKQTPEQLAWAKELEMLGHRVHIVYSLEEFKEVVK